VKELVEVINDDYEQNQLEWWSKWSRLIWFTNQCCALLSSDFKEPLFNHSEILSPKVDVKLLIPKIEKVFQSKGLLSYFFVKDSFEYFSIREFLMARSYEIKDRLSIMEITSPYFKVNEKVEVKIIGKEGIEKWCEIYLLSFYEDMSLFEPTVRATKRAFSEEKTKFILARYENLPVGTLALYGTNGVNGAYCVGTLPRFRNMGVASAMLRFAHELSNREGKKLTLQTFLSDSVENFYKKRGFRRVYLKEVLAPS